MAFKLDSIVKRYLILCEGIDTARFLAAYLESSALADDVRYSNDIQVLNFGGINDLDRFIRNLKNMEYFDDVSRLLVIRDAETDVQKACIPLAACTYNRMGSVQYGPSGDDRPFGALL